MQLSPEQFLALHPVFSRADLAHVLKIRNKRVSVNTINAHLYRWTQQGRIKQVKRGVYVHLTENEKQLSVDKFALCSRLAPDSLLSHHTALELHGVAQSAFRKVTYFTLSSTKELIFENMLFKPVRPRPAVTTKQFQSRWTESAERQNIEIRYTSIERTLVDVLDRPELAGGVDEVWRSCASIAGLRFDYLEQYLKILGRPTVTARVGFFLEQRKETLAVPEPLLIRLQKLAPKSKVYFLRREKKRGRLFPRWNLIVPENLIENDWEGF